MTTPTQSSPVFSFTASFGVTGRSEKLTNIFAALGKAQKKMLGAPKDDKNSHERGYATLASTIDATREEIAECGLCLIQIPGSSADGVPYLDTILGHDSGEWICGRMSIKPEANNAHAIGSAITYMRRYARQGVLGIAPIDDDGAGAMGKGNGVSTQDNAKGTHREQATTSKEVVEHYRGQKITDAKPVTEENGDTFQTFTLANRGIVYTDNAEIIRVLSMAGEKPFDFKVRRKPISKAPWEIIEATEAKL